MVKNPVDSWDLLGKTWYTWSPGHWSIQKLSRNYPQNHGILIIPPKFSATSPGPPGIGFPLLQLVDSNLLRVLGPSFSHAFPGRSCLPKTDPNRNEKMCALKKCPLAEDIPLKQKLHFSQSWVNYTASQSFKYHFGRDSPYFKLLFGVRSCDVVLIHPNF